MVSKQPTWSNNSIRASSSSVGKRCSNKEVSVGRLHMHSIKQPTQRRLCCQYLWQPGWNSSRNELQCNSITWDSQGTTVLKVDACSFYQIVSYQLNLLDNSLMFECQSGPHLCCRVISCQLWIHVFKRCLDAYQWSPPTIFNLSKYNRCPHMSCVNSECQAI